MAGFREFLTGEVLTAANVNNFLMKQSVMVFADAAARTAALGAEVTEGMLTFNKDTGALEVFDGTNFVPAGAEPNLVEVKSAIFTGTQTGSVTAGNNLSVTDLSIAHEVANVANRLIISAFLGVSASSVGFYRVGIAIHDGTGLIAVGAADGNRVRVSSGFVVNSSDSAESSSPSVTFVHTPGAGSKTYTVRAINMDTSTRTLFINRTSGDSNSGQQPRGMSSLVIQEVRV